MRLNLKNLHARLTLEVGKSAPSHVTIKRMSASGAFADMDENQALSFLKTKYQPSEQPPMAASTGAGPELQVANLERTVEALTKQVKDMQVSINQLTSIRSTLQLKYDALCSQQLQTIEAQRGQIREMGSSVTLTMEISRMRGQIQELFERVASRIS